ncbi:hypothetical protein [Streptomyces viridochromogenes]|uniref:hypothetical protein n=1 Tax=Streptomyces viridochromogenes TaxID=1938 RepID=UPI000AC38102|nr:hypothetical protein [Streptomyces viridochromogenes]
MTERDSTRDDEPRVGDEEFISIARDPAMARLLRKQLESLADGRAGAVLAEMAKEVLSGRIGLREAVQVGAYQQELVASAENFERKWDEMSALEKSQAEAEGTKLLRQQQDEIDQEHRERQEQSLNPSQRSRHSANGWSAY